MSSDPAMLQQKPKWYLSPLGAMVLAAILAGTFCISLAVGYVQQEDAWHQQMEDRHDELFHLLGRNLDDHLSLLFTDLELLSQDRNLQLHLDGAAGSHDHLTAQWLRFANARRCYDQIRLIGLDGVERLRIDWRGTHAAARPAAELQAKGHRYYVSETLAYNQGAIFLSPLDLNIEHGAIELPYKPVMRAVTPVFNSAGEKAGLVVLNFLGQAMLEDLGQLEHFSTSTASLLNESGYWLYDRNPDRCWGFLLDRPDATLANEAPSFWRARSHQEIHHDWVDGRLISLIAYQPVPDHLQPDVAHLVRDRHWWLYLRQGQRDPSRAFLGPTYLLLGILGSSLFFALALLLSTRFRRVQQSLQAAISAQRHTNRQNRDAISQLQSQREIEQALSHTGSWHLDDDAQTMVWSTELCHILGHHETNTLATIERYLDHCDDDDREALAAAIADAANKGQATELEHVVRCHDGSTRHVREIIQPLGDNQGHRVCGTVCDISDTYLLLERTRQAEKLQAIGTLAGGIAHDFNNQLTGIIGYAQLALRTGHLPERTQTWLEQIKQAADNSAALTAKLLAFARRSPMHREVVHLHDLISDSIALLERSLDKRIELSTDLAAYDDQVHGDKTLISNAILNLCLNARDAMPEGGRLTIATRNEQFGSGDPNTRDLTPGPYIALTVSDTGIGIPASVRERIFQPFFTTKEVGKGTGMGLPAVVGCMNMHSGDLMLESTVGEGTTFTCLLPLITDAHVHDHGNDSSGSLPITRRDDRSLPELHIMIIDDEPMICDLLATHLHEEGYEAIAFTDPEAGLAHFRDHHQDIDLILLDMVMPKLAGHDCFARLRAIDPTTEVILMSGHSDRSAVDRCLAAGARCCLSKPIHFSRLDRSIIAIKPSRSHTGP